MRNAKEIKMLRLTIPSWRNLTLVITNIIGLEPVRSRMRAKKLPLKSTISTYRKMRKMKTQQYAYENIFATMGAQWHPVILKCSYLSMTRKQNY